MGRGRFRVSGEAAGPAEVSPESRPALRDRRTDVVGPFRWAATGVTWPENPRSRQSFQMSRDRRHVAGGPAAPKIPSNEPRPAPGARRTGGAAGPFKWVATDFRRPTSPGNRRNFRMGGGRLRKPGGPPESPNGPRPAPGGRKTSAPAARRTPSAKARRAQKSRISVLWSR